MLHEMHMIYFVLSVIADQAAFLHRNNWGQGVSE